MSQQVKRFGPLDWKRCERLLPMEGSKTTKVIGPNTTLQRQWVEGNTYGYVVVFHSTHIITYYPDGRVILNSGGYQSATTKQRLNALLLGISIFQKKHQWYVTFRRTGETIPFEDGMNVGARTERELIAFAASMGDTLAAAMLHDIRQDD